MADKTTSKTAEQAAHEELALLLVRAEQGDRSVLPALRKVLEGNPALWEHYGDLALQAEAALVQLAAGANLLMAESLMRKLASLKAELGGPAPSPLERLLVARVTATWLQTAYYDGLIAQATDSNPARGKMLQRHQDGAHRRHLAAIKTLATVRKLLTPALSPVAVASRLGGERHGLRLRQEAPVEEGVPVLN
jgi:hypothetical protein